MTLNELNNAIVSLYPTAVAGVDYSITTDTSGANSIRLWNNALGVQPTSTQLATAAAAYDLGVAKQTQMGILQAAFNQAFYASVAYNGDTFLADQQSQSLLVAAQAAGIAKGGTLPNGVYVKNAAGSLVLMTYAQLQGLISAVYDQNDPAFNKFVTLAGQVQAATTVADVQAVVWS